MLWKLRPLSRSLPLMVILWIVIVTIAMLLWSLLLKQRTRKPLGEKEILLPLPKNAPANPRIRLLTRVK